MLGLELNDLIKGGSWSSMLNNLSYGGLISDIDVDSPHKHLSINIWKNNMNTYTYKLHATFNMYDHRFPCSLICTAATTTTRTELMFPWQVCGLSWYFPAGIVVYRGDIWLLRWFNSLWSSGAKWRQRSGSTLARVMACACGTKPLAELTVMLAYHISGCIEFTSEQFYMKWTRYHSWNGF